MLYDENGHRKILRIPGRKPRAYRDCRGRNKTVRLAQRDTSRGVVAAPLARAFALFETEGRYAEASEEPPDGCLLPAACATPQLFNVDRADIRGLRDRPKCTKAIGSLSSSKSVDQDGRIEKERRHVLADTAGISAPLMTYPLRGIGIPLVPVVRDLPERRHDVIPPALILQRAADGFRDERASLPPADPPVKLRDQSVVEANVHTHAHKLAHRERRDREPTRTRTLQSTGLDEIREQRPLDRPAEPLSHLVLVREHRGANADEHELGERLVLIRFPRLVPHLIPSRELAGVAMPALPIVDGDVARHDSRETLELLTHLPQRGRREAELVLHVVQLRWSGGFQMTHQTRALVAGGVRLRERGPCQGIDRAQRSLMAEEHLAAMHLEREHPGPERELAAPRPLRFRPRPESGRATLVRLLVRRREETRQRGVLREREHAAIDEEGFGFIEGL